MRCTYCIEGRHAHCDPRGQWCECPCDTGELEAKHFASMPTQRNPKREGKPQ